MADWSKPLFENGLYLNPTRTAHKGPKDLAKWMLFEKRTAWPKWVERPHIFPQIDKDLGEIQGLNCVMINHATLLLQTRSGNILTDPVFSKRTSPFSWIGPSRVKAPGLKISDLPRIHVVLVSHNHYDHMDLPSLKKLHELFNPFFLVPLANSHFLIKAGIPKDKVVELGWWQTWESGTELKIHLTPAQHWSSRTGRDRNRSLWGGFWIQAHSQKIFFAGDTGYSNHFQSIREKLGQPHLSLLPIGAYEPRWFMRDQHMNPLDAVQAHLDLQSELSLGIHWGTWQLTNEGLKDPVMALEKARLKLAVGPENFRVLENGESIRLP